MKELNAKNKFRYKLGPGGYKAAMPKWTTKEQELREDRIPDPLEGCMVRTRNWIRGHSHTADSGWLITSSSEVTSITEKAKTPAAIEKTGKFMSKRERDQFSAALKNKEHRGRTWAISSIASWKEEFVDETHMYNKRKTHEIVHNAEETFAQQFINFMRKNPQYVVQVPISEINLDLGATVQTFALSSAGSAPNKDKDQYPMDDIKDATPCTLMYVKGGRQGLSKLSKLLSCLVIYFMAGPSQHSVQWSKLPRLEKVMSSRILTILMKGRGFRNWLMLKGISFSGPAKILLSKLIHCWLFCNGA
jgi:hypothetical protein